MLQAWGQYYEQGKPLPDDRKGYIDPGQEACDTGTIRV